MTVTVRDDDGGVTSRTSTVIVKSPAQSMQRSGRIDAATAASLIAYAQRIIDSIG